MVIALLSSQLRKETLLFDIKSGWPIYCIHVLFVHRLWWRIKCHNKQSLLTISIIKTMLNLCSNIYERLFYHILCLHLRDTKWRKKFSNGPKLTHQMGRQVLFNFLSKRKRPLTINKFALLWGEAQLCLPYVCLQKKIAYSYPKVTYSYHKLT